MNNQELETLLEVCWRNDRLSKAAESIVAKVIAATFNGIFQMDALKTQLREFREIAMQEQVNLGNTGDSELYNSIIRPTAGCEGKSP